MTRNATRQDGQDEEDRQDVEDRQVRQVRQLESGKRKLELSSFTVSDWFISLVVVAELQQLHGLHATCWAFVFCWHNRVCALVAFFWHEECLRTCCTLCFSCRTIIFNHAPDSKVRATAFSFFLSYVHQKNKMNLFCVFLRKLRPVRLLVLLI